MAFLVRMILACVLGFLPASAVTQSIKPAYHVEMQFYVDGALLGKPRLTVASGQPALMIVEKEGGYSIQVTISPLGGHRVQLNATAYRSANGAWLLTAVPQLQTSLGEKASVQFAGDRAALKPACRFEAVVTSARVAAIGKVTPCSQANLM